MRSAVCRCCARSRIKHRQGAETRIITDLTEDDTLPNRQQAVKRNEDLIFVLFVLAVHVELTNIVYRNLVLLQLNLVCVGREFVCEIAHIVRERGGEK